MKPIPEIWLLGIATFFIVSVLTFFVATLWSAHGNKIKNFFADEDIYLNVKIIRFKQRLCFNCDLNDFDMIKMSSGITFFQKYYVYLDDLTNGGKHLIRLRPESYSKIMNETKSVPINLHLRLKFFEDSYLVI